MSERIEGMIGVEAKDETLRKARASAVIRLSPEILQKIKEKTIPKGDVLEQSRVAGIIAAKKTSEWLPLCHPLRLTNVQIVFEMMSDGIEVISEVTAVDRTGVEMEALTAVSAATLNIYDMCKKFGQGMVIENTCLLEKSGGASGEWKRFSPPEADQPLADGEVVS